MTESNKDARAQARQNALSYWMMLTPAERRDVIDGKCTATEYEGVPILDYTRPVKL